MRKSHHPFLRGADASGAHLQGLVGEGYQRLVAGAAETDDFKFHGDEEKFRMDGYFGTSHVTNAFGVASGSAGFGRSRRLIESSGVAFPLRAAGGGSFPAAAARPATATAALGRKAGI